MSNDSLPDETTCIDTKSSSSSSSWSLRGSLLNLPMNRSRQGSHNSNNETTGHHELEPQQTSPTVLPQQQEALWEDTRSGRLLQNQRPERISLTVYRPSRRAPPFGLKLVYDEQEECLRIASIEPNSLLAVSDPALSHDVVESSSSDHDDDEQVATVQSSGRPLLWPGDVLEYINHDLDCRPRRDDAGERNSCFPGDVMFYLDDQIGCPVTFVFLTPCQGSRYQGICQAVIVPPPRPPTLASTQELEKSWTVIFCQRQGLLQIQRVVTATTIAPSTRQKQTNNDEHRMVRPGDYVLIIGRTPSCDFTSADAHKLWNDNNDDDNDSQRNSNTIRSLVVLSDTTTTPSQRRWRQIRRVAVASIGSSMVGVGAVIMVTPLHPVGHAMAIGGVGILGTEFEAPKRALEKVTKSLQRKNTKQPPPPSKDTDNDDDDDEHNDNDNDNHSSSSKESAVADDSSGTDTLVAGGSSENIANS